MTANCQRWISALAMVTGLAFSLPASAFQLEMAQVTVNDTFVTPTVTTVSFLAPFDTTPVVVTLATNDGGDPANLRIANVTTTGFQIVATEPDANDGPHVAMTTAYLAVEPGSHTLPDGSQLQAYAVSTTASVGRVTSSVWASLSFTDNFPAAPAVIANLQTDNNETGTPPTTSANPFLATATRNVSSTGLQYAMERAETTAGTNNAAETIGIIAVSDGLDLDFVAAIGGATNLQAVRSGDTIRGFDDGCFTVGWPAGFATTPLAVASMNSRDGNNGGWLRRCSQSGSALGLAVEEDIDNDSERNHTTEIAGLFGASNNFHGRFDVGFTVTKTVLTTSDPENGDTDPFAIPGASVQYTIEISNQGSGAPDDDSVTVTDTVPDNLALCVLPSCQAGGSVILDTSGSPSPPAVTLGTIRYSNDGGATFGYSPNPDADGFDAAINAIEITLDGNFGALTPAGAPSAQLQITARVN